jgi:AICAR transformylase/IMP cyclohydrolase PurH
MIDFASTTARKRAVVAEESFYPFDDIMQAFAQGQFQVNECTDL